MEHNTILKCAITMTRVLTSHIRALEDTEEQLITCKQGMLSGRSVHAQNTTIVLTKAISSAELNPSK